MSRLYSARIEIEDYQGKHKKDIQKACREEWGFDDWYLNGHLEPMAASAENCLCGGETEDEFSQRMAQVVWKANQGPCEVTLDLTCLEYLPYETYVFDEDDYRRIVKGSA